MQGHHFAFILNLVFTASLRRIPLDILIILHYVQFSSVLISFIYRSTRRYSAHAQKTPIIFIYDLSRSSDPLLLQLSHTPLNHALTISLSQRYLAQRLWVQAH